jgi:hypothetical protein
VSSKAEEGGTGLRLFIAKSITETHGGRIWAENNRGGKGGSTLSTIFFSKQDVVLQTGQSIIDYHRLAGKNSSSCASMTNVGHLIFSAIHLRLKPAHFLYKLKRNAYNCKGWLI